MVEVKDLVKMYGNHLAVDHLSFTVERGDVLGFLGPNGAGKSTTMNMITGYISATEGTVTINGHDIYEEPEEVKKCIGYLPEQPPVYQDMTVTEYLNFVADLKKVAKKDREAMLEDIKKRTGVKSVEGRLIKHLSKGYRQRVGLAQALVGYPELIILDEPTVGLDPMQIIEIRDLIKDLAKEHTIILSSHILPEVSAICDKILIINKGKLVVSDTPEMLSTHLKGTEGVDLCIKGTKEVTKQVLDTISDITKIEYQEAEEGFTRCTVYTASDVDVREPLFYALADAKCPLYEMNKKNVSLEQIFLELTRGEDEVEKCQETKDRENYERDMEQKKEVEDHAGNL